MQQSTMVQILSSLGRHLFLRLEMIWVLLSVFRVLETYFACCPNIQRLKKSWRRPTTHSLRLEISWELLSVFRGLEKYFTCCPDIQRHRKRWRRPTTHSLRLE